MGNKLDSTSLFVTQVNQHADALSGLLSGAADDQIDTDLLARCVVRTSMLAKSACLMELPEWQRSLDAFVSLLEIYRDKRLPWDERIAQITSEIIEKEDTLVANAGDGETTGLEGAVAIEELRALSRELGELMLCVADVAPTTRDPLDGQTESVDCDLREEGSPHDGETEAGGQVKCVVGGRPFDGSVTALRRHAEELVAAQESLGVNAGDVPLNEYDRMRREVFLLEYYAHSMARLIESKVGVPVPVLETLAPVRTVMEDYARMLCSGTDRQIDLNFKGEDRTAGAWLLRPVRRILQHLIGDVFLRCNEKYLRIDITIEERHGALHWALRDNGDNFVTDSRLDRDEYLAFYPGLRATRNVLSELRSLLWVEPDESRETRFAFTTPVSSKDGRFMIWGSGADSVAVHANQLSSVYTADEAGVTHDSHGERVTVNGRNTNLLRLGHVYSGAPTDGDRIAVIGCLERRVAFYVNGEGRLEDGVWGKDAAPTWRGKGNGMAQVGDQRIPLVDADGLLNRYMAIVEARAEEGVSGGVVDDVADLSHSQANIERDPDAPPERSSTDGEVDVLVVEQSQSLRTALEEILSQHELKTKVVGELDAALDFLGNSTASLIISDFRVPSMSARVLADRLRSEGRDTPVLVTTSHQEDNARLLVDRLGVAGYVSKPFRTEELISRIEEFLERSSELISRD